MLKLFRTAPVLVLLAAAVLCAVPAVGQGGGLDFTNYVSVGDSLTAGFISGGLIDEVQEISYPSLIFQQATSLPADLFAQPLVSPPGIPALMQLRNIAPVVISPVSGTGTPLNLFFDAPYNNLAVPGADVGDALNTLTDNGGLHDLILRNAPVVVGTQVDQAILRQPSFVTVWLGNNDALGAATSGVVIEGLTLTPAASFDADYRQVVGRLAATGAPMAVATLPDVTVIPFVATVAPVVADPVTSEPILIGGQVVPLIGPDGPLTPGQDFVLLTATQELAVGNGIPAALGGSGLPLSNQVVLSAAEVAIIRDRTAAFNATIRSAAADVGAAVVDVAAIFDDIARDGLVLGGIEFGADFLTGGLFSFDGVHATPLGYAIIANAFIDAINTEFGSTIPQVGLGPYVFGPLSSRGTGIADAAGLAGMQFRRRAENQLRSALGIPTRERLRKIMRNRGIADVATGGGGGGESGGGAGAGCNLPAGHGKYCDVCGPCKAGEGDCDLKPNQCRAGLVCAQDVGSDYGFHRKIDVCQAP